MTRILRERLSLAAIVLFAVAYAPHCWGQLAQSAAAPSVEFIPPLSATEKHFETQLEVPVDVAFVESPLEEVVTYLQDVSGVQIKLDERGLDDAAIKKDAAVTASLKKIPLRAALARILSKLDLTWIIRDDVLLITTREEATAYQPVRVYPVWDLAPKREDLEQLQKLVRHTIEDKESPWDDVGGSAVIDLDPGSRSLVIKQWQGTHAAILDLLRSLRQARKVAAQQLSPHQRISQSQ